MRGLLDAVTETAGGNADASAPPGELGGKEQLGATSEGGDVAYILEQIEQNIESRLPKALLRDYKAIVLAGRELMFSQGTHPEMVNYLGTMKGPQDIPQKVAHGIVKIISIIGNEVTKKGKKFSVPAAGAAAMTLMTHALKYVDSMGAGFNVDNTIIDQTATKLAKGLFALFKIDEGQMKAAMQQAMQKGPKPEYNQDEQEVPVGSEDVEQDVEATAKEATAEVQPEDDEEED